MPAAGRAAAARLVPGQDPEERPAGSDDAPAATPPWHLLGWWPISRRTSRRNWRRRASSRCWASSARAAWGRSARPAQLPRPARRAQGDDAATHRRTPRRATRFLREVQAAGQAAPPQHRPAPTTPSRPGDRTVLVMEYVEGISLGQLVAQKGPLPVAQACRYVRQAAWACSTPTSRAWSTATSSRHNLMLTQGKAGQDPRLRPGPAGRADAAGGRR